MPRSAPGPVTASPSSSTRPLVGAVEAGDDPQQRRLAAARRAQDGDEVVVGDPQRHGLERRVGSAPTRAGGKCGTRLDDELAHVPPARAQTGQRARPRPEPVEGRPRLAVVRQLATGLDAPPRPSSEAPGNSVRLSALNRKSETRPITPMTMMPKMIWPGAEQRLAVGDHVADAGGGADQLGDDDVGPRPAEHQAQDLGDLGRAGRASARGATMPQSRAPSV